MAFSTRRGRPPHVQNQEEKDSGTPELQAKRHGGNTQELLDRWLAQGILSDDEHWAGIHLRWLYTVRYGAPKVTGNYLPHAGGYLQTCELTPWREAREAEYRSAMTLLEKMGVAEIVLPLVMFHHHPIGRDRQRRCGEALQALYRHFCHERHSRRSDFARKGG